MPASVSMTPMEQTFDAFRQRIVGLRQSFTGPYGELPITYLDWTASGRLYGPIEQKMLETFGPFVGNTHSESNVTGTSMTKAYHEAGAVIKRHVHATPEDVLLFVGFGMTPAILKLQRILGLRLPEQHRHRFSIPDEERPVVFVTHMEHHSNQTTWEESLADVVVIRPTPEGLVDPEDLRRQLGVWKSRRLKIGAFSSCSNVTGIRTPYHELARIMHEHGGWAFVDFAASAPYVRIDMHPDDPMEKLDAITFSPHKFLGGPGASGVLIFDSSLYRLATPDQPGGGTVLWTNPWGGHRFAPEIEVREDGGTPGFLQAIKAALAVKLKEEMGVEAMAAREEELAERAMSGLEKIPGLRLLGASVRKRLPMVPFYLEGTHYNLVVCMLNDRYGIQVRGGCSCAGTYGHFLLDMDQAMSRDITDRIDRGDYSAKPGWVRASMHPTTTNKEVDRFVEAMKEIAAHYKEWAEDYRYLPTTNQFVHKKNKELDVKSWFAL